MNIPEEVMELAVEHINSVVSDERLDADVMAGIDPMPFYDAAAKAILVDRQKNRLNAELLRARVDELLEANNRYQQEARDARAAAGQVLTPALLADALSCFWNASIDAAHRRGTFEAMSVADVVTSGFAAVEHRLREASQGQ